MRRSDRQVTDTGEIEEIIKACRVCRIAMVDDGKPYVVPVNFGYTLSGDILSIYFHSAESGRKIDIFRSDPGVCFEMDTEVGYEHSSKIACISTCYFASVIGYGAVTEITGHDEKIAGLNVLMNSVFSKGAGEYTYDRNIVKKTNVYKIESRDFTAKRQPMHGI